MQVKQKQWLQLGSIPNVCSNLSTFFVTTSKHIPQVLSSDWLCFETDTLWSDDVPGSNISVLENVLLEVAMDFEGDKAQAPSNCGSGTSDSDIG